MRHFKISPFFVLHLCILLVMRLGEEATGLLLALAIHETGHILVAKAQGCKVEKLIIEPLGGYLYLDKLIEVQPGLERRIAFAGPGANLLTAFIAMVLYSYPPPNIVAQFIRASLTISAFNMLPALPLDGGRVLRGILAGWTSYYRATKIAIGSSVFCGSFLLVLAIIGLVKGQLNVSIFAASVFLLYNAWVERRQLLVPLLRYVLARQNNLRGCKLLPADTLVAPPGTQVREVLKYIRPQKYYQISVLNEGYAVAGLLTEHQLLKLILEGTGHSTLQEAITRFGEREE